MNKKSKNAVRGYIRAISKHLNYGWAMRSVLIQKLNEDIAIFIEDKEISTIDDLCSEYGNPKDVAESIISKEDYSEQLKKVKRKHLIWTIISIVLFILLVLATCFMLEMLNTYSGATFVTDSKIIMRRMLL